jgi:hypothetical protein
MTTKSKAVQEPMVELLLKVTEFNPDRTPYKQYNTKFQADNLWVIIHVPKVYLAGPVSTDNQIVLTLDGMAYVNNEIASATERMHKQWMENQ